MDTGIYKIINLLDNKIYVGSACVSFKKRKNHHFHHLRKNTHSNRHLQAAWNKYGEKNFIFEILEKCEPIDCIERETYWCNKLNTLNSNLGYNIELPLVGALGVKRSKETKDKISKKLKGVKRTQEFKDNLSLITKGKKRTDEHKQIISKTHKGKILSDKTKQLISKNSPKKRPWKNKKINQYDKNMNFVKQWESITKACEILKIKNSNITNCLTNLNKSAGGFIWRYEN